MVIKIEALAPFELCVSLLQVQQEHLDAGGIGNDVAVTAAGPRKELEESENSWQILARLPSVSIGTDT